MLGLSLLSLETMSSSEDKLTILTKSAIPNGRISVTANGTTIVPGSAILSSFFSKALDTPLGQTLCYALRIQDHRTEHLFAHCLSSFGGDNTQIHETATTDQFKNQYTTQDK